MHHAANAPIERTKPQSKNKRHSSPGLLTLHSPLIAPTSLRVFQWLEGWHLKDLAMSTQQLRAGNKGQPFWGCKLRKEPSRERGRFWKVLEGVRDMGGVFGWSWCPFFAVKRPSLLFALRQMQIGLTRPICGGFWGWMRKSNRFPCLLPEVRSPSESDERKTQKCALMQEVLVEPLVAPEVFKARGSLKCDPRV